MLMMRQSSQEFEEPDWWEIPPEEPEEPEEPPRSPQQEPSQRGQKRKSFSNRLLSWLRQVIRVLLRINTLIIVLFLTWLCFQIIMHLALFLGKTVLGGAW